MTKNHHCDEYAIKTKNIRTAEDLLVALKAINLQVEEDCMDTYGSLTLYSKENSLVFDFNVGCLKGYKQGDIRVTIRGMGVNNSLWTAITASSISVYAPYGTKSQEVGAHICFDIFAKIENHEAKIAQFTDNWLYAPAKEQKVE